MDNDYRGENILDLLDDLHPESLIDDVRHLYNAAYKNRRKKPKEAIKYCEDALDILEDQPQRTLCDRVKLADAEGRLNLLIASIYLNEGAELEKAREHYLHSKEAYHSMQLDRFKSLAYLGLAITLQKLGRATEAIKKCEYAASIISNEENAEGLHKAIGEERIKIQKCIELEEIKQIEKRIPSEERAEIQEYRKPEEDKEEFKTPEHIPSEEVSAPEEKQEEMLTTFDVFDITVGRRIAEEKATTDLYLLSLQDYQQYAQVRRTFNLTNFPMAKAATYVLELGKVDKISDELQKHDLIFIREETDPQELEDKKVAVLCMDRTKKVVETRAALKIFRGAKDHYFLKGMSHRDCSIIVVSYDTEYPKMDKYYEEYEKSRPFDKKFAYDIAVSGEVIGIISENKLS